MGKSDLMSLTTGYSTLSSKYKGFSAPSMRMKIDGTDLTDISDMIVNDLVIDLSCNYEASGCTFKVPNIYDYPNSSFNKKYVNAYFQIGKKVEIELGYIKTEMVFLGYINSVSYTIDNDEGNYIEVECIDVKGVMMNNRNSEQRTEKSLSKAVTQILSTSAYSKFYTSKKIDMITDEKIPIEVAMESDYEFVTRAAAALNYEFFVLQGVVFFRKSESVTSQIMKLSPRETILSISSTYSISSIVKEVEVRNTNEGTAKLITGTAKSKGKYSSGSSASSILTNSKLILINPTANSEQKAKASAQAQLDRINNNFGSVSVACIGLPEIVPGRFVRIEHADPNMDKKIYITNVRHKYSSNGFTTQFKARLKSL